MNKRFKLTSLSGPFIAPPHKPKKAKNISWTIPHVLTLIDLYGLELRKSGKSKSIKNVKWQTIVNSLDNKFYPLEFTLSACKNKWSTLKKEYQAYLLVKNSSGFGFITDADRKKVYEELIRKNPLCANYTLDPRNTPPYMCELESVLKQNVFTGREMTSMSTLYESEEVAEDDTCDELHSDVDEEQEEEEKDEATDEIRLTNSSPMNNSIRAPLSMISEQVTSSSDNFVQNMTPFIFKDNSSNRGKRGTGAQVIGDSLCNAIGNFGDQLSKGLLTLSKGDQVGNSTKDIHQTKAMMYFNDDKYPELKEFFVNRAERTKIMLYLNDESNALFFLRTPTEYMVDFVHDFILKND